ncbi:MAG TPA: sigma 54-interacting transcriptional regulator, partial [Vicinamibacterales bacterium]
CRVQAGRAVPERQEKAAPIVGSSESMRVLRERIERVAATDFTVLIEGESGTGKELVARQIHELSGRRTGPFVAVNCAAIVETLLEAELFGIEDRTATGVRGRRGKFELADGGTLFLDEIADLSASAQAKLLRALQDLAVERVGGHGTQRVDVRVIAATNRSLRSLVRDGLFRADLFYRLSGVELSVPPLRSRREDILELAGYFLDRHRATRSLDLSPEAGEALLAYDWPGNVRELQRVVENVVCLAQGERVLLADLPPPLRGDIEDALLPSLVRDETLRTWASRYVRLVWLRHGGNKRKACRALGITYHTLQAHLRYGGRMRWANAPVTAARARGEAERAS